MKQKIMLLSDAKKLPMLSVASLLFILFAQLACSPCQIIVACYCFYNSWGQIRQSISASTHNNSIEIVNL
jgi:hypothetical protein